MEIEESHYIKSTHCLPCLVDREREGERGRERERERERERGGVGYIRDKLEVISIDVSSKA